MRQWVKKGRTRRKGKSYIFSSFSFVLLRGESSLTFSRTCVEGFADFFPLLHEHFLFPILIGTFRLFAFVHVWHPRRSEVKKISVWVEQRRKGQKCALAGA